MAPIEALADNCSCFYNSNISSIPAFRIFAGEIEYFCAISFCIDYISPYLYALSPNAIDGFTFMLEGDASFFLAPIPDYSKM